MKFDDFYYWTSFFISLSESIRGEGRRPYNKNGLNEYKDFQKCEEKYKKMILNEISRVNNVKTIIYWKLSEF